MNDSKAILRCIISRKQKACSCTSSTTGAAYAASGACLRARFARALLSRAPLWGSLVACVVYCLRVHQCQGFDSLFQGSEHLNPVGNWEFRAVQPPDQPRPTPYHTKTKIQMNVRIVALRKLLLEAGLNVYLYMYIYIYIYI